MSSLELSTTDTRDHGRLWAARPLRARQARAHRRRRAKGFLQGQVSNDVEALAPGRGCYAAFLTPKGKMLGDLRLLDTGDELLLDTERVALQELFNMIRRFSIGYDVELHKRTLERGLLSLLGPDPPTPPASRTCRRRVRARSAEVAASRCARSAPTSASTCCATPSETRRARAGARRRRRDRGLRGGRRVRARRARPPALRPRPRRHRDPAGGGSATSARCRSRRAATSVRRRSRACTTAASRTAICAGCRLSAPAETGDEMAYRGPDGRSPGERRPVAVARSARAGPRAPRGAGRLSRDRRRRPDRRDRRHAAVQR